VWYKDAQRAAGFDRRRGPEVACTLSTQPFPKKMLYSSLYAGFTKCHIPKNTSYSKYNYLSACTFTLNNLPFGLQYGNFDSFLFNMFLYIVYLSTNFDYSMCRVISVYVVIMAADISKAEAEIIELKDKFGQNCHVICDVGVFSHVISIAFKKWCVKLKFQITGISLCWTRLCISN